MALENILEDAVAFFFTIYWQKNVGKLKELSFKSSQSVPQVLVAPAEKQIHFVFQFNYSKV